MFEFPHRSRITLADGRELFYYDRAADADRSASDQRADMPPATTTSQVRWNALLRDYSSIAGHRQSRTYKPPADLCPLDPSRDGKHTEIPAPDYEVVVFENRFPSYSPNSSHTVPTVDSALFGSTPGAGRCEVVCFSSDHDSAFSHLTQSQVETVIGAWIDRTREIGRIDTIEYVFCFENRGEEIGVTLSHPHGQIYGYPFVPPRFAQMAEAFADHRSEAGTCLQCDLLDGELAEGTRIVVESEHWVCYVPFAARWPYEVRVVPRRHAPDLPALNSAECADLADVYVRVLRAFDGLFDSPTPYIAGWQQAPTRQARDVWHLGVEIFTIRRAEGKLKYLAGSESGAAVWINDVTPENAAASLREALA